MSISEDAKRYRDEQAALQYSALQNERAAQSGRENAILANQQFADAAYLSLVETGIDQTFRFIAQTKRSMPVINAHYNLPNKDILHTLSNPNGGPPYRLDMLQPHDFDSEQIKALAAKTELYSKINHGHSVTHISYALEWRTTTDADRYERSDDWQGKYNGFTFTETRFGIFVVLNNDNLLTFISARGPTQLRFSSVQQDQETISQYMDQLYENPLVSSTTYRLKYHKGDGGSTTFNMSSSSPSSPYYTREWISSDYLQYTAVENALPAL